MFQRDKYFLFSKTIIFNAVVILLIAIVYLLKVDLSAFVEKYNWLIMLLVTIVNFALRLVTRDRVTIRSKDGSKYLGAIFCLSILPLGILSCSTARLSADPDIEYKKDIAIKVNRQDYIGMAVPNLADKYDIEIKSRGKLDLLTLQTCHREIVIEGAKKERRFGDDDKSYLFTHTPLPTMEKGQYCPLFIGGYEINKGRHSWGYVDFRVGDELLPASLFCNGVQSTQVGVSVCQSKAGLIQRIAFDVPVKVVPDPGCELPLDNPQDFEFAINKGLCVYAFMEISSKKVHRLTTFGYQEVLIKGE